MSIDPHTLAVTAIFVSALVGGLQIFSWAQRRSAKDLLHWGLIFLLISLAVGLLTLQGHLPDVISVTLGQGLLVLAHGLLYSSTRIFNGKPPIFVAGSFGAFAWMVSSQGYLFGASPFATNIFASVLIGAYSFLLASEFRQMTKEKFPSSSLATALALFHGLFFFGRAVVILAVASKGPSIAFAASWSAVLALEGVMATVALAYVLLSLSKERVVLGFRDEARKDELTGIGNRREFFERAEELVGECNRLKLSVSLILIDVDFFKEVNDRHGHSTGDKVLQAVATCASSSLPSGALLARLGGDEFAALLPTIGAATASLIGDYVRERVQSIAFAINGTKIQPTVSLGIAESIEGIVNLADLISAADIALYAAKSNGRNRVELHRPAQQGLPDLQEVERPATIALRNRNRTSAARRA